MGSRFLNFKHSAKTMLSRSKELLLAPIEMIRDGESWGEKFCGVALGAIYTVVAGMAVLFGVAVWDSVKNPRYSYQDKDPSSGAVTTVVVLPSKEKVFHRANILFGKEADFKNKILCDTESAYTGQRKNIETVYYTNCKSFNAVTAHTDLAEIGKMEGYLKKAKTSFSSRTLRAFN